MAHAKLPADLFGFFPSTGLHACMHVLTFMPAASHLPMAALTTVIIMGSMTTQYYKQQLAQTAKMAHVEKLEEELPSAMNLEGGKCHEPGCGLNINYIRK